MSQKLALGAISELENYRNHAPERVQALAEDMRENGYRDAYPLEVCPNPGGGFFIITGHGRYAAATLAGLSHVHAVIHENVVAGSPQFLAMQLRENMAREESNPIEDGRAFLRQIENGRTAADIAKDISRSVRYVVARVEAASLDPVAQVLATTPGAGLRYCAALTDLPSELQAKLAKQFLSATTRLGLEAWQELVSKARAKYLEELNQDSGLFSLDSQEWNAALGEYVIDAQEAQEARQEARQGRESLLGVDDLAAALNLSRATILKYLQLGKITPDTRVANTPIWYASTVATMQAERIAA